MKSALLALMAATTVTAAPLQTPQEVKAWREDIAVAHDQFLAKDQSFSPEHRAQAARRLDALAARVPELSEPQIVAELARVAALADNAHTRAYLLRNRGWWRRYPIRIWRFSDGWRVVAVRPGDEALLGGRIIRIGGRPVAEAAARVRPLFAGVDNWADYMAAYSLTSPDALLGTGVIAGSGDTDFEVELAGRRVSRRIAAGPQERREVPEEAWWFLTPAHAAARGWVLALKPERAAAYLSDPNAFYSLRRCEGDVLYLQFNRAENQAPGTVAQFAAQVLAEVERVPPAKMIVDLRFNTGGDLFRARPLFKALAESPIGQTRGRLYEIVGPTSFSAAINHAASLKQDSKAILVGTEPGDRLDFWAEGGNVTLPNSKINLHYADRAHLYSTHAPQVLEKLLYARLRLDDLKPELPARLSFQDYLQGRDPAAEQVVPGGLKCPAA